jgi:hypothetical protein
MQHGKGLHRAMIRCNNALLSFAFTPIKCQKSQKIKPIWGCGRISGSTAPASLRSFPGQDGDRGKSEGSEGPEFQERPRVSIGMEACVGAHHFSRKLQALGHDARSPPTRQNLLLRTAGPYMRSFGIRGKPVDIGAVSAL